jgi:hypothetical protein
VQSEEEEEEEEDTEEEQDKIEHQYTFLDRPDKRYFSVLSFHVIYFTPEILFTGTTQKMVKMKN